MPKVIKPSNPFTNVCWVSVFVQHFLRRHKFWLHRQFSSAQFQKRRNDGDGFLWCYCCRFVLNSKRLLSTSCNKQGQRSGSGIFHGVIPDAFEVRRIVCVKIKQTLNNELKFHI